MGATGESTGRGEGVWLGCNAGLIRPLPLVLDREREEAELDFRSFELFSLSPLLSLLALFASRSIDAETMDAALRAWGVGATTGGAGVWTELPPPLVGEARAFDARVTLTGAGREGRREPVPALLPFLAVGSFFGLLLLLVALFSSSFVTASFSVLGVSLWSTAGSATTVGDVTGGSLTVGSVAGVAGVGEAAGGESGAWVCDGGAEPAILSAPRHKDHGRR